MPQLTGTAIARVIAPTWDNTADAIRKQVLELAGQGVTVATYHTSKGGTINVPVDVAVRRAVETELSQAKLAFLLDDMDYLGHNHVEVSFCLDARESHADWQGKAYQLVGSTPEYPNFHESCRVGDLADGIGGYNCHHEASMHVPGNDLRSDAERERLEASGYTVEEARALTARQRRIENEIRKLERERTVGQALGLRTPEADAAIRRQTQRLREFTSAHQSVLRLDPRRYSVYGSAYRELGMATRTPLTPDAQARLLSSEAGRLNVYRSDVADLPRMLTVSAHAEARAAGRGITVRQMVDAMENPLHTSPTIIDDLGRVSYKMIGEFVTLAINPDTGVITTVYLTRRSIAARHGAKTK
jgi:hypothetical protein